jgi:hypothetical protein
VTLFLWYVGFVLAGDALAYFIGRFDEWGSNASVIVLLTLYFLILWALWLLAVWVTEPKRRAA